MKVHIKSENKKITKDIKEGRLYMVKDLQSMVLQEMEFC